MAVTMYDSSSPQMSASLAHGMSKYGKGRVEQRPSSPLSSAIRWLQIKKYQYEVTLPLYMLTPTERVVFNVVLLVLASMCLIAIVFYLPNHLSIIYNRILYYVEGSNVSTTIVDAVKTTRAALANQTPVTVLHHTPEHVLKEL